MIRNEQRAAGFGNVVAPVDADAVHGMRHEPQDEPQERIGQQIDCVNRRDQREHGAIEENSRRRLMQDAREKIVRAGGEKNSHKGQQIRGGDHAALLLRPRPVLDQAR